MNVSAAKNPGAPPRVFGIVGHPVDHSLSPSIHNPLFAELGLNAVYIAIPVDPTHADRIADLIRDKNLAGVNLTVPFKERVLPLLDEVSGAARRAGAVNVVVNTNGRLAGHNTDGEGFIRALLAEGGPAPTGLNAVLLGAGGAARAIASSLLQRAARSVAILNRTPLRAHRAIESLAEHHPGAQLSAGELTPAAFAEAARGADLVVNCTAGMAGATIAGFDPTALSASASWVDINYWMTPAPCERAVTASGRRFHDGLGMLGHQGALSFERFTGHPIDGERVVQRLREST